MPEIQWLVDMGASPADIMVFIIVVMFAAFFLWRDKQRADDCIRREAARDKELALVWEELKTLTYRYSQVDKLTYGIGIAIQREGKIKLFKQSANSEGDNALNRDV